MHLRPATDQNQLYVKADKLKIIEGWPSTTDAGTPGTHPVAYFKANIKDGDIGRKDPHPGLANARRTRELKCVRRGANRMYSPQVAPNQYV